MSPNSNRLRVLFILVFAICLTLTAQAQESVTWTLGAPNSDTLNQEGYSFKNLIANNVGVAVTTITTKDYLVINLAVFNNTSDSLAVDPSHVTVTYQDDHGKETVLSSLDPRKEAHRDISRAMSLNATRSIVASQAEKTTTSRSTTNGTVMTATGDSAIYSGTSTTTTKAPDKEAQREAESENVTELALARAHERVMLEKAFFPKWLAADSGAQGNVYFKRIKNYQSITVTVPVNGTAYRFVYP
jgi:hypothetical protein